MVQSRVKLSDKRDLLRNHLLDVALLLIWGFSGAQAEDLR